MPPATGGASAGGRGSLWGGAWCSQKGSQTTGRELGPGCEQGTEGVRSGSPQLSKERLLRRGLRGRGI